MATKRLKSLDIVRGLTVAGMILVNNGYSGSFQTLRHSAWNGMTLCDLVFPFFLFIMGISLFLSLTRRNFEFSWPLFGKIAKRSVILFIIGIAIHWIDNAVGGNPDCLSTLRIWGVLQRIAICYFAAALMALLLPRKFSLPVSAILLIIYGIILIKGNGFEDNPNVNILAITDNSLFGYEHLYHKSSVDPEGLLGTVGSLVNVLLGFYCGKLIKAPEEMKRKLTNIFLFGSILLICGYLLSAGLPLNKRIWSPSYALVTSGWCALLFCLVTLLTDYIDAGRANGVIGKIGDFFMVFGVNPLFLYVFSELLAIFAGAVGLSGLWFDFLDSLLPMRQVASLCYALTYVAICYLTGLILWKRQIYIKL